MMGPEHVIFLFIFIVTTVTADRVVTTNTGSIQGITVSPGEPEIEAFLGIPYAEPPVGRLRFRKPLPKAPWTDVYDASHQLPTCFQNGSIHYYYPDLSNMTEDCLYLNVWVPYTKKEAGLKTIMFFTHGGAFNIGSGNMQLYDGTNLARFGDVIVVNSNYRLGVFGFLMAATEDADGNMGLYDNIMALKWVKDNAKSFGGDPDNIVLIGESAGSAMIGLQLLSDMTKNLFKRVIMQGSAPLIPLISEDNAWLSEKSLTLSKLVGCANKTFTLGDNPSAVVQCMRELPPQVLADAEGQLKLQNPITLFPRTGDAYLPKPAIHSLREGDFKDTEMLIGVNEEDGPLILTHTVPQYFGRYGKDKATISRRLASEFLKVLFRNTGQKNEKEIADQYIKSIQNGTSDVYTQAITTALGDFIVDCGVVYHAEFHSMRNPVYFFVFSRRPSSTPNAEWMKTTHFDELQYVFGNPMFDDFTPEEVELSERIMARWVAFAKTGNPNVPGEVEWPRFTAEDPKYLEIKDNDTVRTRPDNYRCEFWRDRFQARYDDETVAKVRAAYNHR